MENARVDPARFHETARLLLEKGAELTPRAAVALGDREAVLRLHREGRLPNEIHMFRGGLLAIAVRVNRLDMVATLLDLGLDPDESVVADDGGRSWGMPLWFASMCGRHEIAELLLARGADVNAIVYACGDSLGARHSRRREDEGPVAQAWSAHSRSNSFRTASRAEKPRKRSSTGRMPGASLNVARSDAHGPGGADALGGRRSDPEIVRMCLPHMTRQARRSLVELRPDARDAARQLQAHPGPRRRSRRSRRRGIYHPAPPRDGSLSSANEHRVTRATMLLDAGASLTKRDPLLKSTPLGWACRWGRIDLVRLYLERGADPLEPDAEPWATPLAWATKRGHHEIVQSLRSAGAGA